MVDGQLAPKNGEPATFCHEVYILATSNRCRKKYHAICQKVNVTFFLFKNKETVLYTKYIKPSHNKYPL